MTSLESFKESPFRYIPPNALTLARPVLARKAVQSIRRGEKGQALAWLGAAWVTDADGTVARGLNATSKLGEILDPAADLAMKAQIFNELEMAKGTKAITAVCETAIVVINLGLFGLSKASHGEIEEPSATILGKVRFSTHTFGAVRLIQKPKDQFASWVVAGASVISLINYAAAAYRSVKDRKVGPTT